MTDDRLYLRARRAYEWSRVRRALPLAAIALPPLLVALKTCSASAACAGCAAALAVVLVVSAWRGETYERAIRPGIVAGGVAFVLPMLGRALGFCGVETAQLCFAACVMGGVIAGAYVGTRMLHKTSDEHRAAFVVTSGTIAALLGTLGCFIAGIAGVLGMLAGVALTAAPIWVWQRVRA